MRDLVKSAENLLGRALGREVSVPMRFYHPTVSTLVLCTACCISGGFTAGAIKLFLKGPVTEKTILGAVGSVCTATMLLGGAILSAHGDSFAAPIEKVADAAEKVSDGDYSVQIPEPAENIRIEELEDLRNSFYTMAEQLDGMEFMRKDFMSNVSHEFKTPIAAISGFCELLSEDDLPPEEQKRYLGIVKEESERLSHLCDNILRMSRLDNTAIVARKEPVKVDEQIRKTVILLGEKYPDRAIDFSVDLEPMSLISDPDLLEQIWINLLDNAVKYSSPGNVILVSGKTEDAHPVVRVSDEGIGISAEKLPHIYDRFYQCDGSHNNAGNGLGLSIVKRIVELIGGELTCTSTEGKGTTFTVRF